jgi:hypothetical protein
MKQEAKKSLGILLLMNTIPLWGVLFFDWSLALIMALYWAENIIVGVENVFRMIRAKGPVPESISFKLNNVPYKGERKGQLVFFFIMHYGIFTVVHGVFVFAFFGLNMLESAFSGFVIGFLSLCASHFLSYRQNYIGKGEFVHVNEAELFFQPYKRVIVLHFVVLLGGVFVSTLGSTIGPIAVLVVIKSGIDAISHVMEHRKLLKNT